MVRSSKAEWGIHSFESILGLLCDNLETVLAKIWANLRKIWKKIGTTLGPHSNYLETILAKLWDHIVTIGGAYPGPVGGIWPFLNKLDVNSDANRIVVHVIRSPGVSQT